MLYILTFIMIISNQVYANNEVNLLIEDYKTIQKEPCETKDGFRIFVSFSMPESLLLSLDKTAQQIGAKLVIRGLKNNSFKETISYIKNLNNKGMIIDIDPKAFSAFDVKHVPSFVINEGEKFDKITGNLSIPYVLEQFLDKGALKDKAEIFIKRLKNENP